MKNPTLVIGNKNYSSWSLRPWIALKQAGVLFDEVHILLDRPDSKTQIERYSPTGKVPVYLEGDLVLWESLAICEYVAERFPAVRLWPEDLTVRSIARAVSTEMHAGFAALRAALPMDIRASHPARSFPVAVQLDIERVIGIWQDCRHHYGQEGDFLFGPFTIADAMFAPVVMRFRTYAVPLEPVSAAYAQAVLALPAMREWIAAAGQEIEVLAQP